MGVVPKVNGRCEAALKELVEQEPRKAGYPFSTWTCADLVRALAKKGFEAVSRETIHVHLQALGYRVLRPVLSIASPDPQYRRKVRHLEKYKKAAKNGEILLYFQDEIDLNLLPGILRCWTLRGSQRKVMTPGLNVKRYGFGAVNYLSGQTLHRIEDHKNSAGFCAFVKQFMQKVTRSPNYHGQKIVLVVDNYRIHHSRKTLKFLEQYADQLGSVVAIPRLPRGKLLIAEECSASRDLREDNGELEKSPPCYNSSCEFIMPQNRFSIPHKEIAAFCQRWKVSELAIFGSALRTDFRTESDVDLLITFSDKSEWGLFDHVQMQHELQNLFNRKVDLVSRRALAQTQNKLLRDEILNTAKAIYSQGEATYAER